MPAKNTIKKYIENGVYHVYNRGVEKRIIFQDKQDYGVFLSYLKEYLEPKDNSRYLIELEKAPNDMKDRIAKKLLMNNFNGKITLLAYCLMPNHFHLLLKQTERTIVKQFLQSLITRYVIYFNKRYQRIGTLFQGVYRAVLVNTDKQLLHLTRYIHRNSITTKNSSFIDYPYSSIGDYLGRRKTNWLKFGDIIDRFSKTNKNLTYRNFVELSISEKNKDIIRGLTLE